jgi:hypothetical protein
VKQKDVIEIFNKRKEGERKWSVTRMSLAFQELFPLGIGPLRAKASGRYQQICVAGEICKELQKLRRIAEGSLEALTGQDLDRRSTTGLHQDQADFDDDEDEDND